MSRSWETISCLLAVDSRKGFAGPKRIKVQPFVFAFINLLFCVYYDQFLRGDADGHYLQLLFFVNASFFAAMVVGFFIQSNTEILLKTSIFPTTGWNRFLFVVLSTCRRPFVFSLWSTTSLFLLVFYRRNMLVMCSSVIIFTLMLLDLLIIASVLFLVGVRSSRSLSIGAPVLILGAVGILVSSVMFQIKSLLTTIPVLSWAADGILAAQRADTRALILNLTLLLIVAIGGILIGRRVC